MPRVAALCGSLRRESYNQKLLNVLIERAPEGLEIVQVDISEFPLFNQDLEAEPPQAVLDAKAAIQATDCVLLVSPEYDYGVPGVLKNAVDWLSRPTGDPTLVSRPMALTGASIGRMGTLRGQLHWRQSWYYFRAPVFSEAELAVSYAATVFDESGAIVDAPTAEATDRYLEVLLDWLLRRCSPKL